MSLRNISIRSRAYRADAKSVAKALSLTSIQERLADIPLAAVEPDPDNERGDLNDNLDELIASLRALGLQERVKLYSLTAGYYLIASGHRRVSAARALGWTTIPAIVTT